MSKKPRPRSDRTAWKPPSSFSVLPAVATDPEPAAPKRSKVAEITVEEIPAACPKCKSTDREKKNGTIARRISGTAQDGRPFNRVKWTYCKCRQCGQGYRVISRINTTE